MLHRRISRVERLCEIASMLLLLGASLLAKAIATLPGWPPYGITFLVAFAVMIIPVIELNAWATRRHVQHLRAHRGHVCVVCHYVLDGLAPAGRCPECGTPYSLDDTAREWGELYETTFT
ncbi:MAG: hypothetical protein KF745_07850 [Phycisphaeraceae bacterium]|nr:hypothetical protein [Phycisphaeraceae bacterium]